jgi:hypothetical protein
MDGDRALFVEGVLIKSYVDALFTNTVPPRRPPLPSS